jgi:putative glutamine amidotransferase
MTRPLRIGISTRLMHTPPAELGFRGKTLLYLEQSLAHWIMSHRALAVLLPTLGFDAEVSRRRVHPADYAELVDALVLQGGADISPLTYGQQPLHPDWQGDAIRDRYEIELIEAFRRLGKPILGICRGAQMLNVAFGGTLLQDIATQQQGSRRHVDAELYDQLWHHIDLAPDGLLHRLYPQHPAQGLPVNSIHHQAIDRLGEGLCVEARSCEDGVVEAIRSRHADFIVGVQWHPEFHWHRHDLLDPTPLLQGLLNAAHRARRD